MKYKLEIEVNEEEISVYEPYGYIEYSLEDMRKEIHRVINKYMPDHIKRTEKNMRRRERRAAKKGGAK